MVLSKNKVEVLPQIVGSAIIAGREKMRLTQEQLAHQACLSKRQIMQLEEGGISTFYSEAHKVTVAKKVAKLLNIDESQVLVDPRGDAVLQENLPFDQQDSEAAEALSNPMAATTTVVEARTVRQEVVEPARKVSIENLTSSEKPEPVKKKSWLPLLLIILVVSGIVLTKDQILEVFMPKPATPVEVKLEGEAKPEDNNAAPQAAPNSGTTPAGPQSSSPATAVNTATAPLPSELSCPKADTNVVEVRITEPSKPGNFVYVQAKTKQVICVVDASGKNMMQTLEAGAAHTFPGRAPFTVLTQGLGQVQVYYQGRPVRAAEQARTVRLVEAPAQ